MTETAISDMNARNIIHVRENTRTRLQSVHPQNNLIAEKLHAGEKKTNIYPTMNRHFDRAKQGATTDCYKDDVI